MKNILQQIKDKNRNWFSPENKRFFGDISYYGYQTKDGSNYLISKTNAFTDMFDGIKKPHFRIHEVSANYKIGQLLDQQFETLEEVKNYIK